MAQYRVKRLLNKRKHPVVDFTDKTNVVGTVDLGNIVEGVGEIETVNGKWVKDAEGYYYWGGGFEDTFVASTYPWWISDFGIDEIWKQTRGEGVTIILLDSGYLANQNLPFNNIKIEKIDSLSDAKDNFYHGTLMSSIISGVGNEIFGVAPSSQIISIKITDKREISAKDFISGLQKASSLILNEKYYIINCSLELPLSIDSEDLKSINNLLTSLNNRNNLIITSAVGNNPGSKTIPASIQRVVSCDGLMKSGNSYSRFLQSNYWEGINIATPGEYPINYLKTLFHELNSSPFNSSQGSSNACAYTSGVIALILSQALKKGQNISFNDISEILLKSSDAMIEDKKSYRQLNRSKLIMSFRDI